MSVFNKMAQCSKALHAIADIGNMKDSTLEQLSYPLLLMCIKEANEALENYDEN